MYQGSKGDLVAFALYPYMFWIGNIFYGLALLFFGGSMYLRYKRFEPVLILIVIFGGVGGLGFLIPVVAYRLFYFILLFIIAVVLWRLFK